MTGTIAELFAALKERLRERQSEFHTVLEMCGDTEAGFWDEEAFDLDALFNEIDKFGAEIRAAASLAAREEANG